MYNHALPSATQLAINFGNQVTSIGQNSVQCSNNRLKHVGSKQRVTYASIAIFLRKNFRIEIARAIGKEILLYFSSKIKRQMCVCVCVCVPDRIK